MLEKEYSTTKIATLVNVSPKEIRRWCRCGLLNGKKSKGRWFFDFQDLVAGRAAKRLFAKGLTVRQVSQAISEIHSRNPDGYRPLVRLKLDGVNGRLILEEGALRIDALNGQLHFNFAGCDFPPYDGALVDGVPTFDRQISVDPTDVLASLNAAAQASENREDWQDAAQTYRAMLSQAPENVQTIVNLGNCHYHLGEYSVSVEIYRAAIQVKPDCSEAWYNLGNGLDALHQHDAAISAFKTAVALSPIRFEIHYNLALTYEKIGARDSARHHWLSVLRLTDEDAACKMAKVFIECEDFTES